MKQLIQLLGVMFTFGTSILAMVNMYFILTLIGASTSMWVIYWLLVPLNVVGGVLVAISKEL